MERIRVGIIGCGLASTWHVDYLVTDDRVEITALADPSSKNIETLLDRIPESKHAKIVKYQNYREMLAGGGMDAVLVLTPHKFHFEQVKASLENNLHVLVEKPLAVSPSESAELVSLAEKRQRVLIVAYQYPCRGSVKYVHEAVRSGALGEIVYFNAMLGLHWHKLTDGWRRDPGIAEGGVLVDSGSHLVDLVLHLTGARVSEVFAFADNDGQKVDVFTSVLVRFDKGRTGVLSAIGGGPFLLDITIVGDKGAITMRDLEVITHVDEKDFIGEIGTYHGHNKFSSKLAPRSTLPVEEFVNAVSANDPLASNGARAIRVGKFTSAVYQSVKTNKPVSMQDWMEK